MLLSLTVTFQNWLWSNLGNKTSMQWIGNVPSQQTHDVVPTLDIGWILVTTSRDQIRRRIDVGIQTSIRR